MMARMLARRRASHRNRWKRTIFGTPDRADQLTFASQHMRLRRPWQHNPPLRIQLGDFLCLTWTGLLSQTAVMGHR